MKSANETQCTLAALLHCYCKYVKSKGSTEHAHHTTNGTWYNCKYPKTERPL